MTKKEDPIFRSQPSPIRYYKSGSSSYTTLVFFVAATFSVLLHLSLVNETQQGASINHQICRIHLHSHIFPLSFIFSRSFLVCFLLFFTRKRMKQTLQVKNFQVFYTKPCSHRFDLPHSSQTRPL